MLSRRWRVISLGILLAFIGAVLPVAGMAWMSRQIATTKELDELDTFARRALLRATTTFQDAKKVLDAIEASGFDRCSPQHIEQMRALTMSISSIEEIGFFDGGMLKCTSWGEIAQQIPKEPGDYVTKDGMDVTLRLRPIASRGSEVTALYQGKHNALVLPSRFTDIVADDISVALYADGDRLLSSLNGPDLPFAKLHLATAGRGMGEEYLFVTAKQGDMTAVVTRSRSGLRSKITDELAVFLPVGTFIALFIVGVVIWLSRKRLSPHAELELAVRNKEFIVYYQPIIELKTGICIGAEALVRWKRPDGSLVRPDLFIPLAEETGLIKPITDQVIAAVVSDLNVMLVQDRTLHIAINLCADDVGTGRAVEVIDERLKDTGIRKEQIWLEATERGFVDVEAARVTLKQARDMGHSVAIDDFGTGYSSLQYLQGLPLDALKIDKSFIDTIGRNTATSTVTLHIIQMAKSLGLFLVAEGVESQLQADYLTQHGVDFGQGWLFSKPLPADEFISYHRNSKATSGAAPEVIQVAR